jgi:hypothetical protein
MEVQVVHAHGKMPLREVTCEKNSAMRQEKGKKVEGGRM